ncbi:MAG: hypothetical protein R3C10_06005 [Pirellulales bacterium]
MQSENGNVRYVVWSELFGWFFLLVRALRLSLQLRKLLIATFGVILTTAGWGAIAVAVSGSADARVAALGDEYGNWPWTMAQEDAHRLSEVPGNPFADGWPSDPLQHAWRTLTAPFRAVFANGPNLRAVVVALLLGFWAIFIWGLFGGAVGRIAAVELATGERYSMGRAFGFARRRWPSYFAAPMMPLSVVFIGTLMMALLGLLMRLQIGMLLAAIAWPIVLLGCAFLVLVLIGLAFGWPLMWSTLSTEGTDAFDAISRAYAYTTQRPLNYLFYVTVASLLGMLGLLLVELFVGGVLWLSLWGVSWGVGSELHDLAVGAADNQVGPLGTAAAFLFAIWTSLVKLIAVGFIYSYLWTAAAATYLLLRRDVDATELDEAYLEDEPTGEGLAPLVNDEAGVPGIADEDDQDDNHHDNDGSNESRVNEPSTQAPGNHSAGEDNDGDSGDGDSGDDGSGDGGSGDTDSGDGAGKQ